MPRKVFVLDPLSDSRWGEFVERHSHATVFHSTCWLEALRKTYGYQPLVVTTSGKEKPLSNGVVVYKVRSWVTGSRLVSLPFSDHCDPLVDDTGDLYDLITFLKAEVDQGHYRYLEFRPLMEMKSGIEQQMNLKKDEAYCIHRLDLGTDLDKLYQRFHKSCVQRKIHKAEREGLVYEDGRSEELLAKFYRLQLRTRRRHQLPPQSRAWFRNLADCMGDKFKIRVASKEDRAIAAIITVQLGGTSFYKYGCSDARYHNLGGIPLLMWRAIQDAKASGAQCFDFGRSNEENKGLVTFKEHWGATKSPLQYHRYPFRANSNFNNDFRLWLIHKTCACLPNPLLEILGAALYKHIG